MAKALGSTIEDEHREGLHKLAKVRFSLNPLVQILTPFISK